MALGFGVLLATVCSAGTTDPGTAIETAAVAKESAPGLVRAGQAVVEVPWRVGQCLRLPLGLVEMVFSPLPGVGFSEGLEDTGHGLVAPFKLCMAVLKLPYDVFGGLGEAVTGLAN